MTQDPFLPSVQTVTVPELGAQGEPIWLVNWLVPTGSSVIRGERIAELLVDSVLFHLEADCNGQLLRYCVPTGRQVVTGEVLAEIQLES